MKIIIEMLVCEDFGAPALSYVKAHTRSYDLPCLINTFA